MLILGSLLPLACIFPWFPRGELVSLEEGNRGAEKHLSSAAEPQALSFPNSGVLFRPTKLVWLCLAKPH